MIIVEYSSCELPISNAHRHASVSAAFRLLKQVALFENLYFTKQTLVDKKNKKKQKGQQYRIKLAKF